MTDSSRYRTPGTRLWWSDVGEWIAAARKIDRRRLSQQRYRALQNHGGSMPRALIDLETDIDAIDDALVRQIDDQPEGDNWIAARASLG